MLAWDRCRFYCRTLSFKSSSLKLHGGVQRRAASPKVWWYQHTPETREELWEREKDFLLLLDDLPDLPLCGVESRLMARTARVSEIFCNTVDMSGDVEAVGNGVYDVLCISITRSARFACSANGWFMAMARLGMMCAGSLSNHNCRMISSGSPICCGSDELKTQLLFLQAFILQQQSSQNEQHSEEIV